MKKILSKEQIRKNITISEIRGLLYEIETTDLDCELVLEYISDILIGAGVESEFVVDILEDEDFKLFNGDNVARNIKVREGW